MNNPIKSLLAASLFLAISAHASSIKFSDLEVKATRFNFPVDTKDNKYSATKSDDSKDNAKVEDKDEPKDLNKTKEKDEFKNTSKGDDKDEPKVYTKLEEEHEPVIGGKVEDKVEFDEFNFSGLYHPTNFDDYDFEHNNQLGDDDLYCKTNQFLIHDDNEQEDDDFHVIAMGNYPAVNPSVSAVPVPAAVWLFGSAVISLLGLKRKSKI